MQRTDLALAACGFDALVIHSGAPITQFLDDQDYPFKPNPHFKAWAPLLQHPHCAIVHRPGSRPKLLFHRPDDYWYSPPELPTESWSESFDLIPHASLADAQRHWKPLDRAALLGPRSVFADADPSVINPSQLLSRLHFDRAVKTGYELECLRRASFLGAQGHQAALASFTAGGSEYDTHMRYLEACGQREEEMPYNNIVAYNEHGAVLHYQHLDRRAPERRRSLLLDAGAQFRGYASDITRTHAAAPGLFADLVEAMERAQLALCEEIRSATDFRDVHLSAHRRIGDVLQAAGLIRLGGQDAVEARLTSVFFPHGIGHLLGLQVHDVGGVQGDPSGRERPRPEGHPYLRMTRMLEPGVVVTVEPGIYFIDSLLKAAAADKRHELIDWSRVDGLRPFGGIRIEDNVVATTGAPENLTRTAFARLAA